MVQEVDLAINMYKKNKLYSDMIRLVEEYRPDLLKNTHSFLASSFEQEGNLGKAEEHYIAAGEILAAISMYR